MDVPARLWDTNVVLSYLAGDPALRNDCALIIKQAERGEIEIRVSTMTQTEVSFLPGYSDSSSEDIVKEFFSRKYVVTILYDIAVAREARRLVRKYKADPGGAMASTTFCPTCSRRIPRPGLKPADAVHLASAIIWHMSVLETTDPDLLKLSKKEGNPLVIIRKPLYEGTVPLPIPS